MRKTAEHTTADEGKFPIESCRERLARRWGLDAVAMSGPCEGRPLCECVCEQLDSRWDRLKDRFAGNTRKVVKLASKLAESYMRKDDLKQCESDLAKMGFNKEAASGIAGYLKAYAMDEAADVEVDELSGEVAADESDELGEELVDKGNELSDLGEEDEGDSLADIGDEIEGEADDISEDIGETEGDDLAMPELPSEEELPGEPLGEPEGDTVVLEIPKEVALELDEFLDKALGEHEEPLEEMGEAPIEEGVVEKPLAELDNIGVEIVTEIPAVEEEVEEVPGKPESPLDTDKQFAVGDEGGEEVLEVEEGCGASCGNTPEVEEACGANCGKKAEPSADFCPHCGKKNDKPETKKTEPGVEKDEKTAEASKDVYAEATRDMRSGHVSSVKFSWLNKFADEQMLRLGPEMSINNTDQQAGGKPLGNAKEKAVEAPKALSEGNVHPDGYTAGGNKFQDGKTM